MTPPEGQTKVAVDSRRPRKLRVGTVASNKTDKTIKVECHFTVKHRKYGKYISRRLTLHAHDPQNQANEGDRVEVMECRPISKTKNWRLVRVVERA